jgi:hypothetical protein
VATDRLLASSPGPGHRRAVIAAAVTATVLCATIAWPGVIDEADLDAKPSNALAAAGVGIAVLLTLVAARRTGLGTFARRRHGDRAAVVFVALLLMAGIPWILANAGFYAGDVPGLRTVFMSKQVLPEPGHPTLRAVHLGNHEGIDGIVLAGTALGLRRVLPRMRATRLRGVLGAYLALMLAYGSLVALNDGWNEQIVKRGWTDVGTPKVLSPGLTASTALLIAITVALYLTAFRVRPSAVE